MTTWIIRGGDIKLANADERQEATTGDLCSGVSVFRLSTKSGTKDDSFPAELAACIGDTKWKKVNVYDEKHFKALEKNIPKTWKGDSGIVKREPPANHYELNGYLVDDVVKLFKSKRTEIELPDKK